MADDLGLYPLSKADGEPIPYDVLRPLGYFAIGFTDVASSPLVIPAVPREVILSVFATSNCIIGLDVTADAVYDGTYQAKMTLIPANTFMNIDHNGAANLTVVGIQEGGGILFVTVSRKWQDTKRSAALERG